MAKMTSIRRKLPSGSKVAAVVIPEGCQLLGMIGLMEAFDAANRVRQARGQAPLYDVRLVGADEPTRTATGIAVQARRPRGLRSVHTLVVGGMLELADTPIDPALLRTVGRLARRASRVVGVCMGSYVLGELGLLDGRRCTTHWLGLDAMRQRFPLAHVEDDVLFTEDGAVLTSAGSSAGIDLALHLIRTDAGPSLALTVARLLVVYAQRSGGQSQFSTALRLRPTQDQRIDRLVSRVVRSPGEDHRVETMAASVAMSPRHFARVFREQTGETPAHFVGRVRVEAAERALARSDASLEEIADECGFASADTMRRTFLRVAGVTPSIWRGRFGLGATG